MGFGVGVAVGFVTGVAVGSGTGVGAGSGTGVGAGSSLPATVTAASRQGPAQGWPACSPSLYRARTCTVYSVPAVRPVRGQRSLVAFGVGIAPVSLVGILVGRISLAVRGPAHAVVAGGQGGSVQETSISPGVSLVRLRLPRALSSFCARAGRTSP